jgi:predicted MFS family arabinose efflux permease
VIDRGRHAVLAGAQAVREVAGNPGIRRIEAAWTLGIGADWAFLVALLIVAYETGGALGVGVLGVIRMIPPAVVGPFTDVVVHRLRGDRALLAVNIARAAAAIATAGILIAGWAPELAYVLAGVCAAADAIVRPIQIALMPALARTPSELVAANVTSSFGEGIGAFVGPLVGGAVAVAAGPAAASVVAGVAFLAAAVAVFGLRFVSEADARGGELAAHASGRTIARALRTLRRDPDVALVFLDFGGQVFVRGMLTTLIVVASIELLGLGDSGVGLLNAAIGLGGFVGAIGAIGLTGIRRLALAFGLALAFWGLPIAVIGVWPLAAVAVIGLFVTGVSNAILDVSGFTILQRGIPADERVSVLGLFEGMVAVGVALGGIAGSLAVAVFGAQGALGIAGAILPILAVASWPRISRLDDRGLVTEREAAALRAIPLFAPLPLTGIDRLAGAARPVTFQPGEVIMRQGEPGDRYVAITGGTVAIEIDGRSVASCTTGEGIGEIALLRRVPRTATATATTVVTGYALWAEDFLAAVAGPRSLVAANAMIEERLAR